MSQGRRRAWLAPIFLLLTVALAGCNFSFWATSPHPKPIGPGCPAWTASTTQPSITPPAATASAAEIAAYNAQLVSQTKRPVRNLYTLTQNLVYHQSRPCRVPDLRDAC